MSIKDLGRWESLETATTHGSVTFQDSLMFGGRCLGCKISQIFREGRRCYPWTRMTLECSCAIGRVTAYQSHPFEHTSLPASARIPWEYWASLSRRRIGDSSRKVWT